MERIGGIEIESTLGNIGTVEKFLEYIDGTIEPGPFYESGECKINPRLTGNLLNDMSLPDGLRFEACISTALGTWTEHKILWKISKHDIDTPYSLGEALKYLGVCIQRLSRVPEIESVGIQEVLTTMSDSYYILVYAIETGN